MRMADGSQAEGGGQARPGGVCGCIVVGAAGWGEGSWGAWGCVRGGRWGAIIGGVARRDAGDPWTHPAAATHLTRPLTRATHLPFTPPASLCRFFLA